jgi:hypothetical protein
MKRQEQAMLKSKNKWALLLAAFVLFAGFAGCGSVKVNPSGDSPEALNPVTEDDRGAPLNVPAQRKSSESNGANVFVCGERSMMGFADWQYDTVYETAVSLLSDELNRYSPAYYRYDGYDIGKETMLIPDAASLKADVRNASFYTSAGLTAESSIPASVRRYNSDKIDALRAIDPWVAPETLEAATEKAYPLENAIEYFEKDALNIVVTDLYELRNGSFESLNELADYDIGVLSIQSEYAGTLPGFASDGSDLIWGSPTAGSYKSHDVKTARYTKSDGTQGTYNYNVFKAYGDTDRISEQRSFCILFFGNGDLMASVMNGLRTKLTEKYADSATIHPEIGSLLLKNGVYSAVCEDTTPDTGGAIEYIALNYGEGYTDAFGFEIREEDDVPPLRVTANYAPGAGVSDRALTAGDFKLRSSCLKLDGGAKEYDAAVPKLTVQNNDDGSLKLILTYDADELPIGEYVYETWAAVSSAEQNEAKSAFLSAWSMDVDDGSLRQWLTSYKDGNRDGIDKVRNLMLHTIGLSGLFEPFETEAAARDVLAVRIYFVVV